MCLRASDAIDQHHLTISIFSESHIFPPLCIFTKQIKGKKEEQQANNDRHNIKFYNDEYYFAIGKWVSQTNFSN